MAVFFARADARWVGSLGRVPVAGEAWFAAWPDAGCGASLCLVDALSLARKANIELFEEVERVEELADGSARLSLRAVDVFEDDLAHCGLGPLRRALDERAKRWGLWVCASLNASQGSTLAHGMPWESDPRNLPEARRRALRDEVVLLSLLRGCGRPAGSGHRL